MFLKIKSQICLYSDFGVGLARRGPYMIKIKDPMSADIWSYTRVYGLHVYDPYTCIWYPYMSIHVYDTHIWVCFPLWCYYHLCLLFICLFDRYVFLDLTRKLIIVLNSIESFLNCFYFLFWDNLISFVSIWSWLISLIDWVWIN